MLKETTGGLKLLLESVITLWRQRPGKALIRGRKIAPVEQLFEWGFVPLPVHNVLKESANRDDVAPPGSGAERPILSGRQGIQPAFYVR